jgi:hypothetical protein
VDSAPSMDSGLNGNIGVKNGVRVKASGAAALKPTEIAMEQIAGKKKSKFWVYAVEPVPDNVHDTPDNTLSQQNQESAAKGHSDLGSGASSPQPHPERNGHSNAHQDILEDEDFIMISP